MDKRKPSEREAVQLIEEMLALMEARGLAELEIEQEGIKIRLKKAVPVVSTQPVEYVAGVSHSLPAPTATSHVVANDRHRVVIKSPMVGTFYRAPAPDAPPFVEVGQDLEVGQVVCIIEAMKLMNEIKTETTGRIVEILVENGAPVEFGQPLFAVEPP